MTPASASPPDPLVLQAWQVLDTLTAHGLAGWNRWVIRQWEAIRSHPDTPAFRRDHRPPRAPRRDRLARYEDLIPRGTSPPG